MSGKYTRGRLIFWHFVIGKNYSIHVNIKKKIQFKAYLTILKDLCTQLSSPPHVQIKLANKKVLFCHVPIAFIE